MQVGGVGRFLVDFSFNSHLKLLPDPKLTESVCVCAESMGVYDDIDADVLRNYQEFALVNIIYLALRESSTSEQSARMTAMDSASKNACEPDGWMDG